MSAKNLTIGIWVSCWALAIACSSAMGQWTQSGAAAELPAASVPRPQQQNWVPRFTAPGALPPATTANYTNPVVRAEPASSPQGVYSRSMPSNKTVQAASYQTAQFPTPEEVFAEGEPQVGTGQLEPVPAGKPIPMAHPARPGQPGCKNCGTPGIGEQFAAEYDSEPGCEGDACDVGESCEACGRQCGGHCAFQFCLPPIFRALMRNDLSVFAGAHGFKGPADLGQNGNFGFHEGINFGAPLGDPWDLGYQLGFNSVHSDFAGFRSNVPNILDSPDRASRWQMFVTGGIFKRAKSGPQWGVAFDLQHDQYYGNADLKQVRSESSWILSDRNEIGYFGAYRAGGDTVTIAQQTNIFLKPTDMFVGFYRRQFELGGEGRVWGGATGKGDGLFGADLRMPLGSSWAIENRFNYLLPKQGNAEGGQRRESWGLVMQLVWYPGKKAACVGQNEFRPLLNVADNATFMTQAQVQ